MLGSWVSAGSGFHTITEQPLGVWWTVFNETIVLGYKVKVVQYEQGHLLWNLRLVLPHWQVEWWHYAFLQMTHIALEIYESLACPFETFETSELGYPLTYRASHWQHPTSHGSVAHLKIDSSQLDGSHLERQKLIYSLHIDAQWCIDRFCFESIRLD